MITARESAAEASEGSGKVRHSEVLLKAEALQSAKVSGYSSILPASRALPGLVAGILARASGENQEETP